MATGGQSLVAFSFCMTSLTAGRPSQTDADPTLAEALVPGLARNLLAYAGERIAVNELRRNHVVMQGQIGEHSSPMGDSRGDRERPAAVSGGAASPEPVAAVSGRVEVERGHYKGWVSFRGGALLTGVLGGAGALWLAATELDPFNNPAHFVVAMIACFAVGLGLQAAVSHGRLHDALQEKDNYRKEMEKLAQRNRDLEERLLHHRLSSIPALQNTQKRKRGRR